MIQITDKSQCSGCHACASVCPKNCITMVRDDEGFLYPQVEEKTCVHCELCKKSCPILTPGPNRITEADLTACAAYTKDENIRRESSSGGLFTELASYVINNGGVVFGAAFDKSFQVNHIAVETVEELGKLRGSKYVQSTIGRTYEDAKKYLETGRTVLFSGTPCQIAGLHSCLGKDYENLISVDIICHGVPSPMVWGKYLQELGKPQAVHFRNKDRGWRNYSLRVKTDKKCIHESRYKNAMIRAFIGNMCLRPSCHSCVFKGLNRQSDITLADFWGIQNVCPEMDDDRGTSLVILNTQKAKTLMGNLEGGVHKKEADFASAIKYNSSYFSAAPCPAQRSAFMRRVHSEPVKRLAKEYCGEKGIRILKRNVKTLIRRVRRQ